MVGDGALDLQMNGLHFVTMLIYQTFALVVTFVNWK